jgi:hypothetical protein
MQVVVVAVDMVVEVEQEWKVQIREVHVPSMEILEKVAMQQYNSLQLHPQQYLIVISIYHMA